MKKLAVVRVLLFFLIVTPVNSLAQELIIDDYFKENFIFRKYIGECNRPIFKPITILKEYNEEEDTCRCEYRRTNLTHFVWIPAAAGKFIGTVPGMLAGAVAGGSIGLLGAPLYLIQKKPLKIIGIPFLSSLNGAATFGTLTGIIGESIAGTPFYIIQTTLYDFPRMFWG